MSKLPEKDTFVADMQSILNTHKSGPTVMSAQDQVQMQMLQQEEQFRGDLNSMPGIGGIGNEMATEAMRQRGLNTGFGGEDFGPQMLGQEQVEKVKTGVAKNAAGQTKKSIFGGY